MKIYSVRNSIVPLSLDSTVELKNSEYEVDTDNILASMTEPGYDELELVDMVNNIKDEHTKTLLILVGYLICNIGCFSELYLDLLRNCKDIEVIKAIQSFDKTQDIDMKQKLKKLKLQDIIKATKLNMRTTTNKIKNIEENQKEVHKTMKFLKEQNSQLKKENIKFSAIYTGYLGSKEQINICIGGK